MKRKKKYFRFSSISGERRVLVRAYDLSLAKEKIRLGELSSPYYRDLMYLGEGEPQDHINWRKCLL